MKKKTKMTILSVVVTLVVAYLIGTFYYKGRFPSSTYVNGADIGGKTLEGADNELSKSELWNKITVKSDTEEFLEIGAGEIEYEYVSTPELPEIFRAENEKNWLLAKFNDSVYTTEMVSSYDKDKIRSMIDGIEEFDKKLSNARVVYSSDSNSFVIEPQSYEIKITKGELFDLVVDGIEKRENQVNIEEYIEQPDIFEDDESLIQAKNKANEYLNLKIKYDFEDRKEVVDGSILKDFIAFDGTELYFDLENVKEYVLKLGRKYDTFGSSRQFETSRGEVITISGGSYGWLIHIGKTAESLIEHIKSGENKTIEPIYSYRALRRGTDDIGDSYVEIDLDAQMAYLYMDGELVVETPAVTGNVSRGQGTPTGIYPINYKERDAILRGETYESPVDYWMPFNKDIGLHDADWRDEFGEDIYKNNGSNGCINLPPGNAKAIYDLVYPGMPVIVH